MLFDYKAKKHISQKQRCFKTYLYKKGTVTMFDNREEKRKEEIKTDLGNSGIKNPF